MGRASLFAGALALAIGCATGPVSVPARRPGDTGAANTTIEVAVHDLVNAHRRGRGLRPLTVDPRIGRLARLHSTDMATGKVRLGHDGFASRAARIGAGSVAENVAYEQGHANPASEMVDGWLRSREHRQNIEGPYERTGIGAARNAAGELYVTQIFAGPGPARCDYPASMLRAICDTWISSVPP